MSSMPSKRALVIAEAKRRLEGIRLAAGYRTDAGAQLDVGAAPPMGEDDPPLALALLVGDELEAPWQGEHVLYHLPLEVWALASIDPKKLADGWMVVEDMLADIKQACEDTDDEYRNWGGLLKGWLERRPAKTLPREPGSLAMGVGLVYHAPIKELWGKP